MRKKLPLIYLCTSWILQNYKLLFISGFCLNCTLLQITSFNELQIISILLPCYRLWITNVHIAWYQYRVLCSNWNSYFLVLQQCQQVILYVIYRLVAGLGTQGILSIQEKEVPPPSLYSVNHHYIFEIFGEQPCGEFSLHAGIQAFIYLRIRV